jgi:hypothetical protein
MLSSGQCSNFSRMKSIVVAYFDQGTATFEDAATGLMQGDGGFCLVGRRSGVVEVTVEGHPGSGSILGLRLIPSGSA